MTERTDERHYDRNKAIWEAHLDGARIFDLAEAFNLSEWSIRKILDKFRAGLDPVTVDETRARLIEILDKTNRKLLKFFAADPPPAFDQKGMLLRDEHGEVVRDIGGHINLSIAILRYTERISKVVGSDAPAKYEFDVGANEAAQEAAAKVIQMRDHLKAV